MPTVISANIEMHENVGTIITASIAPVLGLFNGANIERLDSILAMRHASFFSSI